MPVALPLPTEPPAPLPYLPHRLPHLNPRSWVAALPPAPLSGCWLSFFGPGAAVPGEPGGPARPTGSACTVAAGSAIRNRTRFHTGVAASIFVAAGRALPPPPPEPPSPPGLSASAPSDPLPPSPWRPRRHAPSATGTEDPTSAPPSPPHRCRRRLCHCHPMHLPSGVDPGGAALPARHCRPRRAPLNESKSVPPPSPPALPLPPSPTAAPPAPPFPPSPLINPPNHRRRRHRHRRRRDRHRCFRHARTSRAASPVAAVVPVAAASDQSTIAAVARSCPVQVRAVHEYPLPTRIPLLLVFGGAIAEQPHLPEAFAEATDATSPSRAERAAGADSGRAPTSRRTDPSAAHSKRRHRCRCVAGTGALRTGSPRPTLPEVRRPRHSAERQPCRSPQPQVGNPTMRIVTGLRGGRRPRRSARSRRSTRRRRPRRRRTRLRRTRRPRRIGGGHTRHRSDGCADTKRHREGTPRPTYRPGQSYSAWKS